MEQVAVMYLEQHARPHKKPKSVLEDEGSLRRYILPAMGKALVCDITRKDIEDLKRSMIKTPVMANRVLALLSVIFRLSEEWGLRPLNTNPCLHIKRYKEQQRGTVLSDAQLADLEEALRLEEQKGGLHQTAVQAIRLILFTGCRHNEICKLRWDEVNMAQTHLALKESKTGAKRVNLSPPALAILQDILVTEPSTQQNDYVFASKEPGKPLYSVGAPWRRIRTRVGLDGVRIHDLRHNIGNRGAAVIGNLTIVRDLLGHKDTNTTSRFYTNHLDNDPVRKASNQIGQQMLDALEGKPSKLRGAEVIPLQRK